MKVVTIDRNIKNLSTIAKLTKFKKSNKVEAKKLNMAKSSKINSSRLDFHTLKAKKLLPKYQFFIIVGQIIIFVFKLIFLTLLLREFSAR